MTQKLKIFALVIISTCITCTLAAPATFAGDNCGDTCSSNAGSQTTSDTQYGDGCNGKTQSGCLAGNPIVQDLNIAVDALSGVVGIVVVAMIITGGIQYSTAGNNPSALTAAKQRITNALVAMVAFILIFAFLQWLIPGGVFS